MAIYNTRFTPKRRGPTLSDGVGGSSERPSAKERDPVLRQVGWRTEDIRLTSTGTDVSAGEGSPVYDLGPADLLSVGRYLVARQAAASATAEPLGDFDYAVIDIIENTAGVFTAVTAILDPSSGTAVNASTAVQGLADADLSGAGSDSHLTMFVATADDVTDAAAWASNAQTLVQGNVYLLCAEGAVTRVASITRLA